MDDSHRETSAPVDSPVAQVVTDSSSSLNNTQITKKEQIYALIKKGT